MALQDPPLRTALAVQTAPMLLIVVLAIATLMIDGFDTQLAAFAAPALLREWHIDKLAFAPVFAAALGGMVIGAAAGGALGDRAGRRSVILVSTAIFGICTALVSLTHSVSQMVLLRLIAGLGFGAVLPNVFSLVAEWSPERSRVTMVTLSTVGVPVGGMVGAAIVAWAMPRFGWRTCFVGAGGATLLFVAALWLGLRESPSFADAGLSEKVDRLPVTALFSGAWARRTLGLAMTSLCAGYLGYAFANWVPVMLSMAKLSLGTAISGSFFFNLFAIVGALAMALLIPRLGSRRSLLGSLGVFAVATLALGPVLNLAATIHAAWPISLVMATLCAAGFGVGTLACMTFMLAVQAYPTSLRATGSGFASGLNRAGAFVSPFVGAWLLDTRGNRVDSFMMSALAAICVATLGAFIYDAHIRATVDTRQ